MTVTNSVTQLREVADVPKEAGPGFGDLLYFFAEVGVYVAVAWWGFSRDIPTLGRWGLGLGLLVVFATSWGALASPKAPMPLDGWLDTAFRILWFGLGIAAAAIVITGAVSR